MWRIGICYWPDRVLRLEGRRTAVETSRGHDLRRVDAGQSRDLCARVLFRGVFVNIPHIYIFTAGVLVGVIAGWIIRSILFVRDFKRFLEEEFPDAEIEGSFEFPRDKP